MAMSPQGSVTRWLDQLQVGDRAAAQQLWERYFGRLVGLARTKLQGIPRRAADEEDVALSAFDSFCRGVQRGQFPQLHDRDNLWWLLVTMTVHKAHHLVRHERRLKRGGGAVLDEAALQGPEDSSSARTGLEQLLGREPTPALAAEVAEECQRLLAGLGDAGLRSIALWKMEGDTNSQIAVKLGCALSTVERRLAIIRQLWQKEATS
jgi:DNA-directed RNA polymerase specialized sigma24 family protein